MENVLEIRGLSKKFGTHVALDNVSMTIRSGDIYGLIGRNGAGKTRLLKVITQLIDSTQGSVSLFGSNGDRELTKALKRSGSVIETPVAYDQFTAQENLMYYCKLRGIVSAESVVKETLEFVKLTDTKDKNLRNFL